MAESDDSTEIKETDIVFDCPHCSKSLAIDYRGAGLTIRCIDCGSDVQVPIPEGMELADIDSTEEEQEIRILNLRRLLSTSEYRIKQLETEVEELNSRRETLEKDHADNMYRFGTILEKLGVISKAVEEISNALDKTSKVAKREC